MKNAKSISKQSKRGGSPAPMVDARSKDVNDWRGEILERIRKLIRAADPEAVEEIKWRKPSNGMTGVPVWSHNGILCTGETYKSVVKMTFAKGASLSDPAGLFNSSLEGNTRRAIDFHEGDKFDEQALKELIRAAVTLNTEKPGTAKSNAVKSNTAKPKTVKPKTAVRKASKAKTARPARTGKKPKSD